jgi:formylglycine-generating enzyme required for sulfatase activity
MDREVVMVKIEWVEIPAGKFVIGLTAAQKVDIQNRLYETYGIGELSPALRQWVESTLEKHLSAFTAEEERILMQQGREEYSSALWHREAWWALKSIPGEQTMSLATFYIARFPITHAQADVFYQSTLARRMGWDKERGSVEHEPPDRPEQFAWWNEAEAPAHWLGGRLPTVAEWEKAARGTDGRLYPWGNEWNPAAGNFGTPECRKGDDPDKRKGMVTAVDAYPEGASPYGVMDMVGNLAEWTALDLHNSPDIMGYSNKEMPYHNQWFWALAVHHRPGTVNQWNWYIGCRPVLAEWGRRLWPGYRPELE